MTGVLPFQICQAAWRPDERLIWHFAESRERLSFTFVDFAKTAFALRAHAIAR